MKTFASFTILFLLVITAKAQTKETDSIPADTQVNSRAVMPSFDYPGGFRAWVKENAVYPREAKKKKIQGIVTFIVVIEKDGSVSDVQILKGAHPLLDSAALELMKKMPSWKPGLLNGEPVRVRQTIPIRYSLSS